MNTELEIHQAGCSISSMESDICIKKEPVDEYFNHRDTSSRTEINHRSEETSNSWCDDCGKIKPSPGELKQELEQVVKAEFDGESCFQTFKREPPDGPCAVQSDLDIAVPKQEEKKIEINGGNLLQSAHNVRILCKTDISTDSNEIAACVTPLEPANVINRNTEVQRHNTETANNKKRRRGKEKVVGQLNGDRPFVCDLCSKAFTTRDYLRGHKKTHSAIMPYQCKACGRGFKRQHHLSDHMTTHTGVKRYQCTVCAHGFLKKIRLDHHMEVHLTSKTFQCPMCVKCFALESNFEHHVNFTHKRQDRWKTCTICNKTLETDCRLKIHMESHSDEKKHLCSVCGRAFKHKASLEHHILNIHKGQKPFQCKTCGDEFSYGAGLRRHHRQKHGDKMTENPGASNSKVKPTTASKTSGKLNKETHSCPKCGKVSTTELGHKIHVVKHSAEKIFQCSVCGGAFTSEPGFKRHMRRHTSTEHFPCKECDRICLTQLDLNYHIRVHTGKRNYVCDTCGKSFKTRSHQQQHLSVHSSQKPFKCAECGVAFKRKPNLEEHMRSHTGSKNPFQCTKCDKSFVRPCLLKRHMVKH